MQPISLPLFIYFALLLQLSPASSLPEFLQFSHPLIVLLNDLGEMEFL